MIRVMHVGLGPIGALVARQIASRKGFRIVGAVDVDPKKVGRDVGDVIEAGRKLRVAVTADISRTIRAVKPDVAVLCTSSSLKAVLPQFEEVLKRRVPIVTTTEEAAYPAPRNRRLAQADRCGGEEGEGRGARAPASIPGSRWTRCRLRCRRCASASIASRSTACRMRASAGCRFSRRSAPV